MLHESNKLHKCSNLYSLVHLLLLPAHHHEPPPHGVEGVGHGDGAGGHGLRDAEPRQDARLLARKLLGRVVGAEVDSTVDDDTLNVNFMVSRMLTYYYSEAAFAVCLLEIFI